MALLDQKPSEEHADESRSTHYQNLLCSSGTHLQHSSSLPSPPLTLQTKTQNPKSPQKTQKPKDQYQIKLTTNNQGPNNPTEFKIFVFPHVGTDLNAAAESDSVEIGERRSGERELERRLASLQHRSLSHSHRRRPLVSLRRISFSLLQQGE